MSATPRTDKAERLPGLLMCDPVVPATLARQLELENGELREALQEILSKSKQMPVVNLAIAALRQTGKDEA